MAYKFGCIVTLIQVEMARFGLACTSASLYVVRIFDSIKSMGEGIGGDVLESQCGTYLNFTPSCKTYLIASECGGIPIIIDKSVLA